MNVTLDNLKISAVQSVIPKNKLDFMSLAELFGEKEVRKIIRTTGISSVRVAEKGVTSSDLCYDAAKLLMARLNVDPSEVDGLVFISQTRDYILPQTSSILQHKLGLPESTVCFDLPMGCSGYIYGLFQASLLISSGACEKVLVLAGDTTTRLINPRDRSTRMVFGDAGTATLVEKGNSQMAFRIMNDGGGASQLIIPAGEYRNPSDDTTSIVKEAEDLNFRSQNDLYMDGMGIFEFAISRVPALVNDFIFDLGWKKEEVGLFLLHQANHFMVDFLRKRLQLEKKQVPICVEGVGNTGPSTIPLLISMLRNDNSLTNNKDKVIMTGFGVGLSWGVCSASLDETQIFSIEEK